MWPRGALPFGLAVICGFLLALTSNVQGGVLAGKSAGEHSHSAQESFQKNFLTSFLSQSDIEEKPSSKPEETEPHSGHSSSGDEESIKPRHASKSYRRRDRYDHHDHDDHYYDDHGDHYYDPYEEDHHYDPYEEDHYGHGGYEEKHEDDPFHKASVDCRFTPFVNATTEDECSEVAVEEFDKYCKDVEHCHLKGSCFWDWEKAKKGKYACFCPTPKYDCQKKKQCYWFKYKKEKEVQKKKVHHNDKYDHHGYDDYEEDYYDEPWGRSYKRSSYKKKDRRHKHKKPEKKEETHGVCMHNSERFYNLMARLLKSRGKKDFALKIKYSAAPARGKLPYGPHGPAIIGFGEELGEHLDEIYPDDKYNYQFDEEFDPLLWLGYNHPKHGKHQGHGHKKHGHHGYGGGPYGGGYGGHGYGGYGYGGHYGVGPYDYVHHGHFGKHDYGYGKHHGHKGYGHDKYDHDGGYDDHHEDDYGYDDHHEDDYGYEDRHGYGHKGYGDDYYGYEDPYGPWGKYGRHRRYGHHYGPFNRFGGGHFPFLGQHHFFNPLGFQGPLAVQNPVGAYHGPLVNTVQNPVPANQGTGHAAVPQHPIHGSGYAAVPQNPMPVGQPLPTPYPPIYQPIQPAIAQTVPQPIEPAQTPTYAPEVLPVPVEEVSTKPLDPFFPDALTTDDPPIPSYPSPQPPVIYGPGGLNSAPIPTYGPEVVAPVPIEVAPTAPLDPTLYARELQDQELLILKDQDFVPQSSPAMDFFDPMVEFLPEFRRLH